MSDEVRVVSSDCCRDAPVVSETFGATASRFHRTPSVVRSNSGDGSRASRRADGAERKEARIRTNLGQQADFASAAEADNRRAHVVGRISLYLESVPSQTETDLTMLERRVAEAASRVAAAEKWFEDLDIEERLTSALNVIGRDMSGYANQLEMEWRHYPIRLDVKRLTVTADTPSGPVTMDRMGSAENWLACHLIAHLALHKYFVSADRPLPRFLILDQPTQVYYPPERDANGSLQALNTEDQEAVRRIFKLLIDFIDSLAPKFQLIVTDHADLGEDAFQQAVVERWRNDQKLIPVDWPQR